ncbi:MAG: archaemetzincin family Zn-dependent metalloprotease [Thaumarchaeota archaeon]|nr:MAG: archaemetzincin family Zn-dependent metalloprotease [Nitrososphaerota archaeon]TLX86679.1 MAG: archaemetzincin family Zn-dependent metalloprotease [Nitrososphaerota archaeon]
MEIIIQPIIQPLLAGLNDNTLDDLANDVSREFEGIRVTVANTTDNTIIGALKKYATFLSLFDTKRNQWNSPKLLDWFYNKFKPSNDRIILVILDVDAYSHGLNFVLGEAFPKGGLGVVYLARIKEEFYGLKRNNELFYERMVKECVHELGHIFGFNHCPDMLCVMYFSNSLSDTDFKEKSFCSTCRMKNPIF